MKLNILILAAVVVPATAAPTTSTAVDFSFDDAIKRMREYALGKLWKKMKSPQAVAKAARVAKTLVASEEICNVAALDSKTGNPVSFPEFFILAEDGEPVLSVMSLSSTRKNVEFTQDQGIETSISVRSYSTEQTKLLKYPGSFPHSVAGAPRVSLRGKMVRMNVTEEQNEAFNKIYEEKYQFYYNKSEDSYPKWIPDAGLGAFWAKFEVEQVYLLGGFGGLAYIGDIPAETFIKAEKFSDEELERWQLGY